LIPFSGFRGGPVFQHGLAGQANLAIGADVDHHHHDLVTDTNYVFDSGHATAVEL
jgi:hypothetical protein